VVEVPGVNPTSFDPEGDAVGTAVLVPGRGYSPQAPLLFFTGLALLQHGWRVEHHWWDPPAYESDEQLLAWVRSEVESALPATDRALVVGKSLGTWSTPLAAERGLPAIWLTPILEVPELVDAIRTNPAPQLLIGGSDDQFWDAGVAAGLSSETCTVVEIPGVDHAMLKPGDAIRGAEAHVEVTRAVDDWLAAAF
jgi:predicted alpha/beta-hydrolase family hydrolase